MLKDLTRALSLANLCYIVTWNELLNSPIRRSNNGLAIVMNVLALGAVFWLSITLARRSAHALPLRLARFFFPLVLLIPIKGLIRILLPKQQLILIELFIFALAIALIGLFEVRIGELIVRVCANGVLILAPFLAITFYQAALTLVPVKQDQRAPKLGAQTTRSRVLWFLFDELDQRLTFSDRSPTLHLPELDRLRGQSIYGTNCFPPSDATVASIPALLSGQLISHAEFINETTLMITLISETPVNWKGKPNLFTDAYAAGFNTAVIGWHIPYCSLIGDSLTSCTWIDYEATTLPQSIRKQALELIGGIPLASGYIVSKQIVENSLSQRRKQFRDYSGIREAAMNAIGDESLGLVLIHWPVPHPPGIYSRRENSFELTGNSSYLDNLELVDRTIGELRRALESSGHWNDIVVLVTSDHWMRSFWKSLGPEPGLTEILPTDSDQRVPFLLKLSGQVHPVTYDPVFNNVLTHDLVLALLKGEISTPDRVVSWLDQNRSNNMMPARLYPSN